jgi:hypothetical protein
MIRALPISVALVTILFILAAPPLPAFSGAGEVFEFSASWMTPADASNQQWNRHEDGRIDEHDLYILIGEFHQPGPDPTATPVPTPTPTVPAISGTWIGTLEKTSGPPAVPIGGSIIVEVGQTGGSLSITMRPDNQVWTGTIEGNTVTASGLDNRGYPTDIEGTLSGGIITGTYSGRDDGSGISWSGNLTLRRPGPRVDAGGIWLVQWFDDFDSDGQPTYGYRIAEFVQNGNEITVEALADGETGAGYVEGNVMIFRIGGTVEGGTVFGDFYYGTYTWDLAGSSSWGYSDAEKYVPGTTVNAAGNWNIDFTEIYSDKPSPKPAVAFDMTVTQTGNDITLDVTGFGTFNGRIYGYIFVTTGTSSEGDLVRIDGYLRDDPSIDGTVEGEGENPWWWGTYDGSRQ